MKSCNQFGGFIKNDDDEWMDFSEWLIDANWEMWIKDYYAMEDMWNDCINDDCPMSFHEFWLEHKRNEQRKD